MSDEALRVNERLAIAGDPEAMAAVLLGFVRLHGERLMRPGVCGWCSREVLIVERDCLSCSPSTNNPCCGGTGKVPWSWEDSGPAGGRMTLLAYLGSAGARRIVGGGPWLDPWAFEVGWVKSFWHWIDGLRRWPGATKVAALSVVRLVFWRESKRVDQSGALTLIRARDRVRATYERSLAYMFCGCSRSCYRAREAAHDRIGEPFRRLAEVVDSMDEKHAAGLVTFLLTRSSSMFERDREDTADAIREAIAAWAMGKGLPELGYQWPS